MQRALMKAEGIVGGRSALAGALGVLYSTIGCWYMRDSVPVRYWRLIEQATNRRVTIEDLLADVKPAPGPQRRERAKPARERGQVNARRRKGANGVHVGAPG